ncbi:MAG: ABC transporter ATP-binding protein [Candidatus Geothermarchaeales archaeon]
MPEVLSVQGLNSGYGRFQVLFDVDAEFKEKEITVIVGPNGSGKTTLLRSIFGITNIYTGLIRLDGQELTRLPPHVISRRGVAYLPQTENVFENLSVRENMMMASYTLGDDETEDRLEETLQIFPVLKDYMKREAKSLSGGERQMLAMGMALVRRPTVMMFDEPTGALSPKLAEEVLMKIVGLRETLGITIVLVEQHARRALEVGDKAYLMVSGRPIFDGQPEELMGHEELARLYLGIKK